MRAHRLRDLHRERADTAARAVDEHALSWLDLRVVAKTLERGAPRDAERRGLLERQVARLQKQPILTGSHVLRE